MVLASGRGSETLNIAGWATKLKVKTIPVRAEV